MALFGGIGEVGVWSVRSSCVSENKKARIARDRRPASRVVRGGGVVDLSLSLSLSLGSLTCARRRCVNVGTSSAWTAQASAAKATTASSSMCDAFFMVRVVVEGSTIFAWVCWRDRADRMCALRARTQGRVRAEVSSWRLCPFSLASSA